LKYIYHEIYINTHKLFQATREYIKMEISNYFKNLPLDIGNKIINYVVDIHVNEKRKEVCYRELKLVIRYLQYSKINPPIWMRWMENDTPTTEDSKHIKWVIKLVSVSHRLHENEYNPTQITYQ